MKYHKNKKIGNGIMDNKKIVIGLIIIIGLLFFFTKSSFGNLLNNNYTKDTGLQYNCNNDMNRIIPSGKLPGSTIILTNSEREGLLKRFIDNGQPVVGI